MSYTTGYLKHITHIFIQTNKPDISLERHTYLPWISQHQFLQSATIYILYKTIIKISTEKNANYKITDLKEKTSNYEIINSREVNSIIKYIKR